MRKIKGKANQVKASFLTHRKRCSELEILVSTFIDFDFSIDFREDEGLIIAHNDSSNLAMFSDILEKIELGEDITVNDFTL
jgi:hypothetical protein